MISYSGSENFVIQSISAKKHIQTYRVQTYVWKYVVENQCLKVFTLMDSEVPSTDSPHHATCLQNWDATLVHTDFCSFLY